MLNSCFTPFRRGGATLVVALAAVALVILGCTAAPPGSSPTPATTPTTPATPAASPTPAEGHIEHPTGSTDVVLRMETGGGFVPFGWLQTQVAEFTLYGDGTFLIRPLEDPDLPGGWEAGLPRLLEGQLDEATIQDLLQFALTTGRLAGARDNYRDDQVADASTTVFTLNAAGLAKEVSVYALSEVLEPRLDAADRAGFHQLAELLRSFEGRARGGELGEIKLYEPSHYRLILLEAFGDPVSDPIDWPWADLTPADFVAPAEFEAPVAIVSAADAERLVELPSGGHIGVAVTHEGRDWLLAVRPLLPDEVPAD